MNNNHNIKLSEARGLFYRLCHHRPREKGLSREDFFTELWAYVLRMHPELLRLILEAMGANPGKETWTVETQVEYPAASLEGSKMLCRPDLRLGNESARILIEHKIESKQHEESLKTDEGVAQSYNQLTRYLAVDSEALVAFVTVSPQKIDADTLKHPRKLDRHTTSEACLVGIAGPLSMTLGEVNSACEAIMGSGKEDDSKSFIFWSILVPEQKAHVSVVFVAPNSPM